MRREAGRTVLALPVVRCVLHSVGCPPIQVINDEKLDELFILLEHAERGDVMTDLAQVGPALTRS